MNKLKNLLDRTNTILKLLHKNIEKLDFGEKKYGTKLQNNETVKIYYKGSIKIWNIKLCLYFYVN